MSTSPKPVNPITPIVARQGNHSPAKGDRITYQTFARGLTGLAYHPRYRRASQ